VAKHFLKVYVTDIRIEITKLNVLQKKFKFNIYYDRRFQSPKNR
jgi:hypothetical protein